jgi:hypothetical protein
VVFAPVLARPLVAINATISLVSWV